MDSLFKTVKGGDIHPRLDWRNITPWDGNFAFGYYDRTPLSKDNRYHLAIRFKQQVRLPRIGEKAEVGIIDLDRERFIHVADTEAWCHQQGAMTQWLPNEPGHFIFNDFRCEPDGSWRLISRVFDINGDHVRDYDYPVYRLSPDGAFAVTLNFNRIPRRGYTYARATFPRDDPVPDVENDGLFLLDLKTGDRRLVFPYSTIFAHHPDMDDFRLDGEVIFDLQYHWMNHACFNIDGSRVMVLHRYKSIFPMWKTYMWTLKLDGTDFSCSLPNRYWASWGITHQLWGRTPREILVDGNKNNGPHDGKHHEYLVFDERDGPDSAVAISRSLGFPGHLIFSPDGEWLVGDSYPKEQLQYLNLTRVSDGEVIHIATFFHSAEQRGDWRCDLHPRWSADGNYLTVDTIHFGERKIIMLDVASALDLF
ncbi:MAG: hypothetical protein ACTSRA_03245 [Promethearchaeota archaeon]